LQNFLGRDPNCLIAADSDVRFSDVEQEKEKLKRDLRDEQNQVVGHLRQKIDSVRQKINYARNLAESIGITDFTALKNDLAVLDRRLAEIDNLCANNAYLDLLKADRMARDVYNEGLNVYERNIEGWIKVKNIPLDKLKSKESSIEYKSYAGWGWCAGILSYILMSIPIFSHNPSPGGGVLLLLGVSIGVGFFTSYIIRKSKLSAVRQEIEIHNNIITKLSDLKKK
jgi:hypothetical protein